MRGEGVARRIRWGIMGGRMGPWVHWHCRGVAEFYLQFTEITTLKADPNTKK